jgi:hypothetical protein
VENSSAVCEQTRQHLRAPVQLDFPEPDADLVALIIDARLRKRGVDAEVPILYEPFHKAKVRLVYYAQVIIIYRSAHNFAWRSPVITHSAIQGGTADPQRIPPAAAALRSSGVSLKM